MEKSIYACIDLKSFYASVEAAERKLDPFKENLVVADPSRGRGAICLAVTPALKSLGIKNRCRLFEIPETVTYITAKPRMKLYMEYSARIYSIYLKYVSKEDIHVYSIDECFLDFVPSPEKYTLKEYLETYDNLFLLKAFTKRYAMAGVRLGYGLCGNKGLLRKMEGVCQPWNVSSMAQAAGLAALQEREYVEKGRQVTFQELAYLKEELAALGYPVYPSQANYVFFTGPADLYEKLEQKKILIRDCSNYTGLSKGYYRVAVKKHEENQQLVRALKEIDRTKVENVIL